MTISRFPCFPPREAGSPRGLAAALGVWMAVSLLLGGVTPVRAGSGGVMTLPLPRAKVRSGLKVVIDTRWVEGTGYRPVRVRVSSLPPRPAPADRSIKVTLRPRGWRMANSRTAVTQTIELPQGAMYGEATMAIPHFELWNMMEIETREDGDRLPDLSVRGMGIPVRTYYGWSEATPSILVLDKDAPSNAITTNLRAANSKATLLPDIRALASRVPMNNYNGYSAQNLFDTSKAADDADILRLLMDLPRVEILPPEGLPDRWIELSCVDIIIVSFAELERLARELPSTWQAIRDWQACGGTLCVFGVGEAFQRLADLERRLAAVPLPVDDRQPQLRGWREPNRKGYSQEVFALAAMNNNSTYYAQQAAATAQGTAVQSKDENPPDPRPFVLRDVRQGEVVALRAADPFPGDSRDWAWLLNSVSSDEWMWYRRHGMSMHRENPEYWNLLIPGVGEAPVNSFLVLITLFVVVIGPLNYWVLKRQRRLYLILVSVPLGAVIVTGCLLTYALLTDGLGVRVRTRSVTEIDQPSGQVVAWSRQAYYAGLAPTEGMVYPGDAAVYPVEHRPASGVGGRTLRNLLVWDGDQHLAAGFLTTRSTKQFLVVESRRTTLGLTVDETAAPPRVTNRLGVTVDHLIARISSGELFAADGIAPGATAEMAPVTGDAAGKQWLALLASQRPNYPVGLDPRKLENFGDFFDQYDYSQDVDAGLSRPTFKSSVFERKLRDLMANRFSGLEPRAYLAAVSQAVEVSLGVEDARAEAGFHLVTGRW